MFVDQAYTLNSKNKYMEVNIEKSVQANQIINEAKLGLKRNI